MNEIVVFRKRKKTGEIVALFPELPGDVFGVHCLAYRHVHHYSAADYHAVIRHSIPSTPQEFARLARELRLMGHDLRPIRRATDRHHEQRRRIVGLERQHPQEERAEG